MTSVDKGVILAYKREPGWTYTNIWRVTYRVRIRGEIKERVTYVTGLSQCHNNGEVYMPAALAVAGMYGGKRIRILSTKFVDSGVKES
jgi:hypothetical protein